MRSRALPFPPCVFGWERWRQKKRSKSKHASGSDSESDIMMGFDEESSDSVSAKSEGVKDLQKKQNMIYTSMDHTYDTNTGGERVR